MYCGLYGIELRERSWRSDALSQLTSCSMFGELDAEWSPDVVATHTAHTANTPQCETTRGRNGQTALDAVAPELRSIIIYYSQLLVLVHETRVSDRAEPSMI